MARVGPDLTQRMVVNQWVSFPDEPGILKALPNFRNLNDVPDILNIKETPVLGYVYVDHDAGISLKVEGLYITGSEPAPEMKAISRFIRDSVSLKFRFDIIQMLDLHILHEEDRIRLSLPERPVWLQFYESPLLKATRDCSAIDALRAEGYFDDVHALLAATVIIDVQSDKPITLTPEIVWVRLKEYSDETRQFKGVLLNQPHQEFGIKKNDVVSLLPVKVQGEVMLIIRK